MATCVRRRRRDAGSTLRLERRSGSSISASHSAAGRASSVFLGLLLAIGSLGTGSGCSWLTTSGSSTHSDRGEQSSLPAQPSTVSVPGVDEELVGPPLPEHLRPEAAGDEEMVGPPLPPPAAESVAETPLQRAPEPAPPSRTELLIAQLERRGISASQSTRGVVIVLPESVFGFGTAELPRESKRRLHDIADAIVAVANRSRVSVEGHTDSTGADLYNRGLSDRRAKAVGAELVTAGVGERRVRSVGYGADYPIAPNQRSDGSDDPAGRARNRRVEIVIETAMSSAH